MEPNKLKDIINNNGNNTPTNSNDSYNTVVLMWVGTIVATLLFGLGGIVPIVVFFWKKDSDPIVRDASLKLLNLFIAWFLALILAGIMYALSALILPLFIGIILSLGVVIHSIANFIIGFIAAINHREFKPWLYVSILK